MPEKLSDSADKQTLDAEEKGEDEEESIPDYVFPLFFTSKTQELFECKADEDVTAENPNKLISKERILEDYKERAAISDFHPAKSLVQVSSVGLVETSIAKGASLSSGDQIESISTKFIKLYIKHTPLLKEKLPQLGC